MFRRIIRRFRKVPRICFRLPPHKTRFCTEAWRNDAFYFSSAIREVYRLSSLCGLHDNSRILDIGSGQGRLAIGLQAAYPSIKSYTGIDVHRPSVDWCNRHLAKKNFQFIHVDTPNERYNPKGSKRDRRFPIDDGSVDIAFLYSVFAHMRLDDIRDHLTEITRVLVSSGKCLTTVYAETWEMQEQENPPGYLKELGAHSGPLHRVVIDKTAFERACRDAGLSVAEFFYRSEAITNQSVYVLTKTS